MGSGNSIVHALASPDILDSFRDLTDILLRTKHKRDDPLANHRVASLEHREFAQLHHHLGHHLVERRSLDGPA
ncbi:MAG: hypothetical protein ACK56I_25340 [bacterium]